MTCEGVCSSILFIGAKMWAIQKQFNSFGSVCTCMNRYIMFCEKIKWIHVAFDKIDMYMYTNTCTVHLHVHVCLTWL